MISFRYATSVWTYRPPQRVEVRRGFSVWTHVIPAQSVCIKAGLTILDLQSSPSSVSQYWYCTCIMNPENHHSNLIINGWMTLNKLINPQFLLDQRFSRHIRTSRGCNWGQTDCSTHISFQNKWRKLKRQETSPEWQIKNLSGILFLVLANVCSIWSDAVLHFVALVKVKLNQRLLSVSQYNRNHKKVPSFSQPSSNLKNTTLNHYQWQRGFTYSVDYTIKLSDQHICEWSQRCA